MYDARFEAHAGAKMRVWTDFSAIGEDVQILDTPAPTFQVMNLDRTPLVVPAVVDWTTPQAVTGYENLPGPDERAWFDLATSGYQRQRRYVGRFVASILGADGGTRQVISDVEIVLNA